MQEEIDSVKAKGPLVTESDIEKLAAAFLAKYPDKVSFFCKKAFGEVTDLSLKSFRATLSEELKNAIISFINNKYNLDNVRAYLLSSVKTTATRLANESKKNVFVCPACTYFQRMQVLQHRGKQFVCFQCSSELNTEEDPARLLLLQTFAEHNKKGYRCPDCNRFLPKPANKNAGVSCPYPDCCFSGKLGVADEMAHPRVKGNVEIAILDSKVSFGHNEVGEATFKDKLADDGGDYLNGRSGEGPGFGGESSTSSSFAIREAIDSDYNVLMEVIDSQQNSLHYSSNESTLKHKFLMYDAYRAIIKQYPREMISYLVHLNRNGGLQHKIFQEYVSLLEKSFPYSFKKNGKIITVSSLLDPNLCIFDGISTFHADVKENGEVDNATEELYVGSRKGFYCRPYYIGKVSEIVDAVTEEDLMDKVKEYSFFKVYMDPCLAGAKVRVTHYRIPPHYQMGGMVYLNRIRRKIVDKVYQTIHKKPREPSR